MRWVRLTAFADFTTAAQPIADKSDSYALRAESKATPFGQNQKPRPSGRTKSHRYNTAVPAEGVGGRLADDLARSGSKRCACGGSGRLHLLISRLLRSRSPTSQAPTPSGQNPKPRPAGRIKSHRYNTAAPAGRRHSAWQAASAEGVGGRLADDLARSGSKRCACGGSGRMHLLISRLLRSRSPTSQAPTPFGPNPKPRPSGRIQSHAFRAESKATPFGQNQKPWVHHCSSCRSRRRSAWHAVPETVGGSEAGDGGPLFGISRLTYRLRALRSLPQRARPAPDSGLSCAQELGGASRYNHVVDRYYLSANSPTTINSA